jgi:predicted deacylase
MSLAQLADSSRELRSAAEAVTAELQQERTEPQITKRDLSPFARGNAGIPYAFSFDSGRPGPHVMITSLAHGNEPGGLEAVITLLERDVRPAIGRLSLAICNIAAYEASNGVDPYGRRFVEEDFNRVWSDDILDSDRTSIELRRARELRPLVASADVLLDLHATPYEATPFHVLRPGSRSVALAQKLGPRTRFLFNQGSAHSPTLSNYRQFSTPDGHATGLTLECGLFFARSSKSVALSAALELLHLQGLLAGETGRELMIWRDPGPRRTFVIESVQPTHTGQVRFLSKPGDFRRFRLGEIAAFDGDSPIAAPFEGALPLWIKQDFVAGEQAFMWARQLDEAVA